VQCDETRIAEELAGRGEEGERGAGRERSGEQMIGERRRKSGERTRGEKGVIHRQRAEMIAITLRNKHVHFMHAETRWKQLTLICFDSMALKTAESSETVSCAETNTVHRMIECKIVWTEQA